MLEGRDAELSQFSLGVDVFDRDASFDPAIDAIVRVEAGRLRSKLTEYYTGRGLKDAVLIDLPKGGYAPRLRVLRREPESTPQLRIRLAFRTWAALMLLCALAGMVLLVVQWRADDLARRLARGPQPSIAVLPFDNMGARPEQAYFSDGITEDIITDLSIIPELTVIARHSTYAYKDRPVTIRDVARDLNVSHVLEGSVRKEGSMLRITAQLIDAASGAHVWASRYDRSTGDVFAVQTDVARKVAAALEIALTRQAEAQLARRGTSSIIAQDAYLQGRESFYQFTRAGVNRAVELFGASIEADPEYADAYAWKSRALVYAFIAGFVTSKSETIGNAIELARKSTRLDSSLPMGHANLAWALRWDGQYEAAAEAIGQAVALNRNFAEAYVWQSLILSALGRGDEALAAIERSMALNPHYGVTSIFAYGRAQLALGRPIAALGAFDRGIRRNPEFLPNHVFKVHVLELSDDKAAVTARQAMEEINPGYAASAAYRYYLEELPQ